MQEYTVTITSKGQMTMPISIRRALGVNEPHSKLRLLYNPNTKMLKVEKPASFADIRKVAQGYAKKGIKPLQNPREFYESREEPI